LNFVASARWRAVQPGSRQGPRSLAHRRHARYDESMGNRATSTNTATTGHSGRVVVDDGRVRRLARRARHLGFTTCPVTCRRAATAATACPGLRRNSASPWTIAQALATLSMAPLGAGRWRQPGRSGASAAPLHCGRPRSRDQGAARQGPAARRRSRERPGGPRRCGRSARHGGWPAPTAAGT
jgi:hypothetical protein